ESRCDDPPRSRILSISRQLLVRLGLPSSVTGSPPQALHRFLPQNSYSSHVTNIASHSPDGRGNVRPLAQDGTVSATATVVSLPHGRVPPHNLDAEKSLLGGILLEGQALGDVVEIVRPEEFYRDAHRKVFEAMCALFSKNQPIDRITVKDELTALGAFEAVGGDEFIDLLDKIVPTAANLAWYAKIVHDKALARRL